MLLSVELSCEKDPPPQVGEVTIHLDREGLDALLEKLNRLKERDEEFDVHFMTESWGSGECELTEELVNPDSILVNQMTIDYWPRGHPGK